MARKTIWDIIKDKEVDDYQLDKIIVQLKNVARDYQTGYPTNSITNYISTKKYIVMQLMI